MNWKKIKDYDYICSKQGEIKRLPSQSSVKIFTDKGGYKFVYLWKNDKRKIFYVHILIAKTWIKELNKNKIQVDHINRNRGDNNISNLRWVTPKENLGFSHKFMPYDIY